MSKLNSKLFKTKMQVGCERLLCLCFFSVSLDNPTGVHMGHLGLPPPLPPPSSEDYSVLTDTGAARGLVFNPEKKRKKLHYNLFSKQPIVFCIVYVGVVQGM